MAVDARPIEVENVLDEERLFGGDIVWWILLLIISLPALLFGLAKAPQLGGFLMLIVAGIAAGISFAQIVLRLPYLTRGFAISVLIVVVLSVVIGVASQLFSMTLPVTTAPPDVLYKPPISGG